MKTYLQLGALALTFIAPAAAKAQGMIGIHGLASLPLTELKQNRYGKGGGVGFEVLSNPLNGQDRKVDFRLGGGFYYLYTGGKNYELMLDSPQTGMADVAARNNVFALQVVGRFTTPVNHNITAYGDIFGGMRIMNTGQTITPKIKKSDYEDETTTKIQTAFPATYGLGAGFLFRMTDNIYLDMGAAYTWGTKARYIAMRDVYKEGNEIMYPTRRSSTDMLLFRVGVTFKIDFDDCGDNDYGYESGNNSYHYTPRNSDGPKKPNLLKKNPPKVDY